MNRVINAMEQHLANPSSGIIYGKLNYFHTSECIWRHVVRSLAGDISDIHTKYAPQPVPPALTVSSMNTISEMNLSNLYIEDEDDFGDDEDDYDDYDEDDDDENDDDEEDDDEEPLLHRARAHTESIIHDLHDANDGRGNDSDSSSSSLSDGDAEGIFTLDTDKTLYSDWWPSMYPQTILNEKKREKNLKFHDTFWGLHLYIYILHF